MKTRIMIAILSNNRYYCLDFNCQLTYKIQMYWKFLFGEEVTFNLTFHSITIFDEYVKLSFKYGAECIVFETNIYEFNVANYILYLLSLQFLEMYCADNKYQNCKLHDTSLVFLNKRMLFIKSNYQKLYYTKCPCIPSFHGYFSIYNSSINELFYICEL